MVVSLVGGVLVMAGALLPWLTLFAGLQRYSGMVGWYGRGIFASGTLAVAGALWRRGRPPWWLRRMIAGLGAVLVVFSGWLLLGLHQIIQHGASPMLVPRAGPGLFVVLAGAGLLSIAPAVSMCGMRRALAPLFREPTAVADPATAVSPLPGAGP
ncbi:MAG TPA: hypothetical protein VGR09_03310 [Gemmatimonadales bacterium]|nr:hypothetical protein [Gemmatimonadales bacterium]